MALLYINNNGEVLKNEGGTLAAGNRGHLYGDGLFETIRVFNGRPLNVNAHFLRMIEGAMTLKMRVPSFFSADFFKEKIEELLKLSGIEKGGRVRLSIDRVSGGTYAPESNEVSYFIEVYPLNENEYVLNVKGLEVDLYTAMRKHRSPLSNFKTKNGLLYVMSAIEARERQVDELLITDSKGAILEGTSSNLFVVSNGVLYTPGLEEGCLGGVMRMTIINIALANGIKVYECALMPQNLLSADELFLTNAIKGVMWVSGYRTKRFKNEMSRRLTERLNNYCKESV
ncbi:MAG: aminotransferase class IV [Brumimicrobium sp.]|nr:aminotransferase class IV [Brumimicrobium sp.]